jgi:hypothetical protein
MKVWIRILLVMVATVVVFSALGFRKTYFGLVPLFEGVSWMVHFHVFTVVIWFTLLTAQALLAGKGSLELHRLLGRLSYVWVPVVLVGFALATHQGQLKHKSPQLLGAAFFDGGLYLYFYILAIANRKHTPSHAQYMILTAAPFINPGLGRFISPAISVPLEFLLILTLFLTALLRKRPYRPYLVGLVAFLVGMGVIMFISIGQPWIMEGLWNLLWG